MIQRNFKSGPLSTSECASLQIQWIDSILDHYSAFYQWLHFLGNYPASGKARCKSTTLIELQIIQWHVSDFMDPDRVPHDSYPCSAWKYDTSAITQWCRTMLIMHSRVWGCYSVTFLNMTPKSDWCVIRWESKNKHPYRHMLKRNCTTSSSFINYFTLYSEHNWEEPCILVRNRQPCTSNNHNWIKDSPIFNPIFVDATS